MLLDRNRNVIITDFGFANQFSSAKDDLMATSCGSPCYAAPELVVSEGLYVGSAVDIWSCGVILYAMLCGYLPFDDDPANPDGDNINLLYKHILSSTLEFPDYVSPTARDLLEKMLVPDPSKRCDIHTIMDHPWLKQYRPLFAKSIRELEFEATTSAELTLSPVGAEAYRYAQQTLGLQEFSAARSGFTSDYDLGNESSDQVADDHALKEHCSEEDEGMEDAVVPSPKEVSDSLNYAKRDLDIKERRQHNPSVQMNQVVPMEHEDKVLVSPPKPSRTYSTAQPGKLEDPLSPKPSHSTQGKPGHRKGYSTEKFFSLLSGNASSSMAKSAAFGPLRRNNTMNLSPTPSSTKAPSTNGPPRTHSRFGSVSIAKGTGSILHAKFLSSVSGSPSRRAVNVENEQSAGPWPATSVSASMLPSNIVQPHKSPLPTPSRTSQPASAARGTRRKALSLLVTPVAESSDESADYRWLSGIGAETGRKALAFARRASVRSRPKSDNSHNDSDRDSGTMEGIVEDDIPKDMREKDRQKTTGKKMMDWIKRKSHSKLDGQASSFILLTDSFGFVCVVVKDIRSPISISSSPFDQLGRSLGHAAMRSRPPPFSSRDSQWVPEEAKLRIYHGAVDQAALTSRPPNEVFKDVKQTLQAMGIEIKRDSDYKIKCTRPKRKMKQGRPTTSVSSGNASVDTLDADSGMSLTVADQKKRRISGSTTFRNLLRRSSGGHDQSHESIPPHLVSSDEDGVVANEVGTASSLNSTASGKVAPIYGDASVDSGDEIRFSIELCKFKNLPGLYIVDIRRMRGNVWGYKFVYHQLLEALDLYSKGGYIPGIERQPPSVTPISAIDTKQNEFNNHGLGSIAEIQV